MKIKKLHIFLLLIPILNLSHNKLQACSMYKITVDGKTIVGCNHDAWLSTPKVWFENAPQPNEYGASFTGAREVDNIRTAPQSGMNTAGLAFSRLSSYHPKQNNPFTGRLKITDEVNYLTNILHKCATISDVRSFINQYDHSYFMDDIFVYIDSLGDYLIVEPYTLIQGNEPHYVLANFCPSITDNKQARKMERYRNGEDFLKRHHAEASLDFCTALSDTMHVCRKRNGDGTLITSIWDTKDKSVNLYFYHSYDTVVQFRLTEELAKGNHILSIPAMFPKNSEFERLVNYKTPSNTIEIRILLVILAGLLAFFPFVLAIAKLWKNKYNAMSTKSILTITILNILLIAYVFILITNKNIFYFDAPYKHYSSSIISLFSYTPFLLLLLIGPVFYNNINNLHSGKARLWIKTIVFLNNLIYIFLIAGFAYWGLYNIWT